MSSILIIDVSLSPAHMCTTNAGKLHAQFGLVYSSLHLFEEAIQSFERALPLIRIGKSSTALQTEASLLQNIGAAYNERGFYSEAVIYHREAAALHGESLPSWALTNIYNYILNLQSVSMLIMQL